MLKVIRCEKFREKEINFHLGLNVVLGDEIASNSIGKSTLLMIIDFVFGGRDYITKNADAVENLGSHKFEYIFEFNGEEFFFSRSTERYLEVNICNEKFETESTISLDDYNKLLQRRYNCELDELGFRSIVGRYFRVYGKENLNEHKPIQYFEKEPIEKSIEDLIKLFDKFSSLKSYRHQMDCLKSEQKITVAAARNNLIPMVSKATFEKNDVRIRVLNQQLQSLKQDIINVSSDVSEILSKEIMELRQEKQKLINKKNALSIRYKRIKHYLEQKSVNSELELDQVTYFFPGLDLQKVNEIEAFHNKLSGNLEHEMKESRKDIAAQLQVLDEQINLIDTKISDALNLPETTPIALDKVIDLVAQIKQLQEENKFYSRAEEVKSQLKVAKKDFSELQEDVINDISSQINTEMYEINKVIYGSERRAPTLNLQKSRYSFSTFGDTGTGTAFANLITFDLALLNLTCLPAIVHDLPLLKNIENHATEKIVELYSTQKKQIFIAIDKINTYSEETTKLLEECSVVNLSKDSVSVRRNQPM